MFRKFLSLLLGLLLMQVLNVVPVFAAQTRDDAQAVEKVRLKVAKVGLGDKARVTVKMKNGTKVKGFVTQAGADNFTVRDRKTADPTTILYSDVAKVEDNRGHSALRNVLIGVGVGAGVLLVILAAAFASLND
jgi:Tfp pilus assembly protein PilV